MSVCTLTKEKYASVERWYDFFDSGKELQDISYDTTWYVMFQLLQSDARFNKLNDKLKEVVMKDKHIKIFPHPSYLFSAFTITPASDLKVVIIGQDPYFNHDSYDGKWVPQAMGLSFSVPHDFPIPSSLDGIYNNMIKYGHLKEKPKTGNLWFWATQGCLMLNAALSVENGIKKSHAKIWKWFTDGVIKYISTYMNDIIFVIWGGDAYEKIEFIDEKKHHTIISSHPSGLSAHKPFQKYPAFMNQDHFGKINEILQKSGKTCIIWN